MGSLRWGGYSTYEATETSTRGARRTRWGTGRHRSAGAISEMVEYGVETQVAIASGSSTFMSQAASSRGLLGRNHVLEAAGDDSADGIAPGGADQQAMTRCAVEDKGCGRERRSRP